MCLEKPKPSVCTHIATISEKAGLLLGRTGAGKETRTGHMTRPFPPTSPCSAFVFPLSRALSLSPSLSLLQKIYSPDRLVVNNLTLGRQKLNSTCWGVATAGVRSLHSIGGVVRVQRRKVRFVSTTAALVSRTHNMQLHSQLCFL